MGITNDGRVTSHTIRRNKLTTLKRKGIITNRRQLTKRDQYYKHRYLSNFRKVWDKSVVNMVKFYRTSLPQVEEGYRYNQRTLYYHKLLATERRKDRKNALVKAMRLRLWKKAYGSDESHLYSDETHELSQLYKPEYNKYSFHAQQFRKPATQLREQESIRQLASKWYYLEQVRKAPIGKAECLSAITAASKTIIRLENINLDEQASV